MVTPRYRTIRERRFGLRDVARLRSLNIDIGDQSIECAVKSGFVTGSKVQVYFLDNRDLFPKPIPDTGFDFMTLPPTTKPSSPPTTRVGATSNYPRPQGSVLLTFSLLNHAALQLMMLLNWIPDIIHCNGWQTALLPYLIRCCNNYRERFAKTRTIVHLHNLRNLGLFSSDLAAEIGIEQIVGVGSFQPLHQDELLRSGGKISFLKAGLSTTDLILTFNTSLLSEICSSETSIDPDLIKVINDRRDEAYSFQRGVDVGKWNPSRDIHISAQYTEEELEGKRANRETLLKELDLPVEPAFPVIVINDSLVTDEGFKLLKDAEEELMALPAQFIFFGVKDAAREKLLRSWVEKHQQKVCLVSSTDEKSEHRLLAGADILLIPSNNETSWFYQMYSLIYGTVPVVLSVSSSFDSVVDYAADDVNGNGFTFSSLGVKEMIRVLKKALTLYKSAAKWEELCRRGMKNDFGWTGVGGKVVELYREIKDRPPYHGQ